MKKRGMTYILIAEAAACVVFCLLRTGFSGAFTSLAAFPFEQTGYVLRRMSLSGAAGNVAAIALYVALGLLPCLAWLILKRRGRLISADHLLPVLSILLLAVNYYMVNPGLVASAVPGTGKWMLGCTFYSALSGYLVIRVLAVCRRAGPGKLESVLQGLLGVLNMVFVYLIFGQNLAALLKSLQDMQGAGAVPFADGFMQEAGGSGLAGLFFGFRYLVTILPYVFDLGIVFLAGRLLSALKADPWGEASARQADRLAGFCAKALGITAGADVIFNVLQVLFRGSLSRMDIVIHVPVISILFVLAALLSARYIHEAQKLKQEHDLII